MPIDRISGFRTQWGSTVVMKVMDSGKELALSPRASLKVRNHSPTGFEWGYAGSGPAQLSLAILLLFYSESVARENYQKFKFDVVARLPKDEWVLTRRRIEDWMTEHGTNSSSDDS